MHDEVKAKAMTLASTKDQLAEAFKAKLAEGMANMDASEAGEVTDMIKDLAEADKLCWEARYYEAVVKAMEESDERGEHESMGYDAYRYADGRFAPSGRGTRSGYTPMRYMDGTPMAGEGMYGYGDGRMMEPMGYTDGRGDVRGGSGSASGSRGGESMGYTESGDAVETLAMLWQNADKPTKMKMRKALEEMSKQLGV